ncbi:TonB-dependent hemoglobin/transferrin/lactoferrin family receptor [Rhizobium sp. CF080]|uniref:TonB-dependent hemoglobin/transferrin/lactoferrin family receptor n=1 Tax=Rhizobium sp. (strain CF080) TaxID=1144310 RepID=UPI0002DCE517|nr:TonB-dependent hemoglobin/transferrin/lactoferrin family receptor [Rhizobium sp. CF080]
MFSNGVNKAFSASRHILARIERAAAFPVRSRVPTVSCALFERIVMVTRRLRSTLTTCTALAVFSLAYGASAQQTTQPQADTTLRPIVLKGKRTAQPGGVADTPLATTTTQQDFENKQITNLEDLGRVAEPGVNFNRTTGAVSIRGLEGNRVLTTIDGIPAPFIDDVTRNASGGVDAFDFGSLSGADVIRGADSSRAGPGALGGVLGLRTLEAEDLIGQGRDWGGIARTGFDGADLSGFGSVGVAKKIENTSILFQGGYKKGQARQTNGSNDGLYTTRTEANPSLYDQYNLLFKLRHEFDGGHTFGITAERFRRDRDTDSRTLQFTAAPVQYRPGDYDAIKDTDRDRVSLDYKFQSQSADSPIDNAWASFYYMKQYTLDGYRGIRSVSVLGPIGRDNDYEQKSFGLIGAMDKTVEFGTTAHKFTFGFDLARIGIEQYSSGFDNCGPGPFPPFNACNNLHTNQADTPKVATSRIGLYLDDQISFENSAFTVTPGIRLDWVKHDPKMTPEYDRNASNPSLPSGFEDFGISPKLRLGYDVNDDVEIFAQYAAGFRAPTAGEMFSSFGATGTYLRLGNPDLETETSNGFELGTNLGDEKFGGRINLFYNRYKNFIDPRSLTAAEAAALGYNIADYPQGGISRYQNIADVEIFGVEASVHKLFDNGFRVSGGLAYARGNDLSTHTFLRSVPPLKVVASAGYDTETWGVGVDWMGVRSSLNNDGLGGTYFKTPGYGIFDLTAWWEPEQVKGLKINAGIYNVFDRTYYDYSTVRQNSATQSREFYSEPGRTFKVSLTQRF